jgi:hypothetical protein
MSKPLTWGDLANYINSHDHDPDFTTSPIWVIDETGAFRRVLEVLESEDDPVIDDGMPYLVTEEI